MADPLPRTSPLAALAGRFAAASEAPGSIRLGELPFLAQLTLRAEAPAARQALAAALDCPLPVVPNTTAGNGKVDVIWMGPDEWLAVTPGERRGALEAELGAAVDGHHASVVDVSAQRTIIELAGAAARDVLQKGCSLDLHPRSFGPGRCAQTALARAPVILEPRSEEPAYRLFIRASFSEYLAEWLLDAAAEYRAISGVPVRAGTRPERAV